MKRKGVGMNEKAPKDVFNIRDEPNGKSKWTKVGQAFLNKDGSINVLLDSFPSEGKLQIRERRRSNTKRNNN
jgi:hypothetical protein